MNFLGTSKQSYTAPHSRPMSTHEHRVSARLEKFVAAGSKESDPHPVMRNASDYQERERNRDSGFARSQTSISPSDRISEEPDEY